MKLLILMLLFSFASLGSEGLKFQYGDLATLTFHSNEHKFYRCPIYGKITKFDYATGKFTYTIEFTCVDDRQLTLSVYESELKIFSRPVRAK